MTYVLAIVVVVAVLAGAFIWWRATSVGRGAKQRDERLLAVLDPVAYRLSKDEPVKAAEIAELSRQPQFRPMLYQMLKHFNRLDLLPEDALTVQGQGAGILSYWMMHPNEMQDPPQEIQLVQEVDKEFRGERGKFLVFRFRMAPGHWAAKDEWLVGLAGPFFSDDAPYEGVAGGFSRCGDKYEKVDPVELIDWYVSMVARKSA